MVMMIHDDHGDVPWLCLMLIHNRLDVQAHGADVIMMMMMMMMMMVCVSVSV